MRRLICACVVRKHAVKRIKKRGRFCFVCVKHPQSKHPDDSEDNMKTGHMLKFLLQTGDRTCDSSVSIRPLEEEHVVYTNPASCQGSAYIPPTANVIWAGARLHDVRTLKI